MGLYATDKHLVQICIKHKSEKQIKNSLIACLVQALVQASTQVDVPKRASKVGSDDRLPVTLEGHRLLVVPETGNINVGLIICVTLRSYLIFVSHASHDVSVKKFK